MHLKEMTGNESVFFNTTNQGGSNSSSLAEDDWGPIIGVSSRAAIPAFTDLLQGDQSANQSATFSTGSGSPSFRPSGSPNFKQENSSWEKYTSPKSSVSPPKAAGPTDL